MILNVKKNTKIKGTPLPNPIFNYNINAFFNSTTMKNHLIFSIVFLNFFLFLGKILVGVFSHSMALISDAINSLSDTINALVVLWATHIARKKADQNHHAGHGRAQPLAAFFIAIMTAILAFEIIKEAVFKLFTPQTIENELEAVVVMIVTIVVKGTLSFLEYRKGKKDKNSALIAMSTESRGDVFISLGVIFAILLATRAGIYWADPLIAIVIGCYVFYTGYEIAKENIDFLMGASAKPEDEKIIRQTLKNIPEIKSFHDLRTQYLGEELQVTVHCIIRNKNYTLKEWHDIEAKIARDLEKLEKVARAFVHLDPYDDSGEE